MTSPSEPSAPLTVPPATVIALWNTVAEDTGTLDMTLLRFANLLLAEAQGAQISRQAAPGAANSAPDVPEHPPILEATA